MNYENELESDYACITGYYRFPSLQSLWPIPLRQRDALLAATGLYIVFNERQRRPLYIGSAVDFTSRVKVSSSHKTLLEISKQYPEAQVVLLRFDWNLSVEEFATVEIHNEMKRLALRRYESAAIQFYNPLLNKVRPTTNLLGPYQEDDLRMDEPLHSPRLETLMGLVK